MKPAPDLKLLKKIIREHKCFLISSHVNVEPDALGSELAFASLLKKLGKSVRIVNDEATPARYKFMPGSDLITCRQVANFNPDVAVVLDASDLNRIGRVRKLIEPDTTIVNIDHHISNSNFGHCNIVDKDASSACEIVYEIFSYFKIRLGPQEALNLYAGILTDTGSFHYSNTRSRTFQIAARLLKFNLDVNKIYRQVYRIEAIFHVHLLGRLLQEAKTALDGEVIYLCVTKGLPVSEATVRDLSEEALNILRLIVGAKVFVLFRMLGDRKHVRINLRSHCHVDVNKVAKVFNGGGHMRAAGATVKGTLMSARKAVFREIKKYLQEG